MQGPIAGRLGYAALKTEVMHHERLDATIFHFSPHFDIGNASTV